MLLLSELLEEEAVSFRIAKDRLGSGNPTLVNWFDHDSKKPRQVVAHDRENTFVQDSCKDNEDNNHLFPVLWSMSDVALI